MSLEEMTHMHCCNVIFSVEELQEIFEQNNKEPLAFANVLFRRIDRVRWERDFGCVGWDLLEEGAQ